MITYTDLKKLAIQSKNDRFWYSKARCNIRELSKRTSIPFKTLAGVVAITSQNIKLSHNQTIVLDWINNGANIEASKKIKHFGIVKLAVERFLETGEVRGPKIKAFYDALTGDVNSVVLDTHMAKIFIPKKQKWAKKDIEAANRKIKNVAKELGWKPYQVQAAIWCSIYKKEYNTQNAANYCF